VCRYACVRVSCGSLVRAVASDIATGGIAQRGMGGERDFRDLLEVVCGHCVACDCDDESTSPHARNPEHTTSCRCGRRRRRVGAARVHLSAASVQREGPRGVAVLGVCMQMMKCARSC
jgi:hypothetical protein